MSYSFDVVIVGSGIAGLTFALKVAEQGHKVAILTKKNRAESNTNYAQGGIAAVTSDSDDLKLHIEDTIAAGDGLCDPDVVQEIIDGGPERIQELIQLGVDFSKLNDGRISLGKEGGHSKRRILHVKDSTGNAIETALLHNIAESPNITMYEHFFVVDLLTQAKLDKGKRQTSKAEENDIVGLYALDVYSKKVETFNTKVLLLATGGIGQIYQYTSNPSIATGDGIAMAYRRGVDIVNMEFVQFHPTTLYSNSDERFLITEAVRGEGGTLRNLDGKAFMKDYHPQGDLAPRDIVARAIDQEMKRSGAKHVWLDITSMDKDELLERFPMIYEKCQQQDIDISKEFIPVVPAAHYLCGGIRTELDGETSIQGLYACGEAACTGLHGANRLASNSLLEAVVMSDYAAKSVHQYLINYKKEKRAIPDWIAGNVIAPDERVVLSHNLEELKRTMWDYVGIVRSTKRLQRAKTRIDNLSKEIDEYYWNFKVEPELLELRNMIQVADSIIQCALQRKESRGLHCTIDFKNKFKKPIESWIRRT